MPGIERLSRPINSDLITICLWLWCGLLILFKLGSDSPQIGEQHDDKADKCAEGSSAGVDADISELARAPGDKHLMYLVGDRIDRSHGDGGEISGFSVFDEPQACEREEAEDHIHCHMSAFSYHKGYGVVDYPDVRFIFQLAQIGKDVFLDEFNDRAALG